MTQAEFIQTVQVELVASGEKVSATVSGIKAVLQAAGAVSLASLADGQDAPLFSLGTLKAVQRAARTGRNPKTGAAIKIPAKKGVKFVAGKALKDALKE